MSKKEIEIYEEMKKVYKDYSNSGVYDINYSKELDKKEMKELLLLLNENDD